MIFNSPGRTSQIAHVRFFGDFSGGILQSVEESKKKTSETLEVAFSDLSALMGKAADLVSIAEKLTKRLETEGNDEENTQMRSYLIELGISSPVTRFSLHSRRKREKEAVSQLVNRVVLVQGIRRECVP